VNGKCEKVTCPTGEHYDPAQKKCIPDKLPCPPIQGVSGSSSNDCPPCPKPENGIAKMCPPPPPVCKKGEHYDPVQKKCVSDCPPGFHLQKGVCTKNIVINVKKKVTTTVETVFRNIFVNANQPKFLLLLASIAFCVSTVVDYCTALAIVFIIYNTDQQTILEQFNINN